MVIWGKGNGYVLSHEHTAAAARQEVVGTEMSASEPFRELRTLHFLQPLCHMNNKVSQAVCKKGQTHTHTCSDVRSILPKDFPGGQSNIYFKLICIKYKHVAALTGC